MLFKQYKTSINEDDTVNIHDVEIFKLGNHKGFDFNKEWAEKALANFNSEKQNDYLPSVIIGHNKPGGEEKPAKGFMDNLRVNAEGVVISDISKVPPATFESMKNREYPHRSVEVNPQKHKFTALALLGGTPPYHKLPVMEFHDDEDHQIIDFEIDLAKAIKTDEKYEGLFRVISKIRDAISSIRWDADMKDPDKNKETKSVLKQASTILSNESKTFKEGMENMSTKDLTPEQLQAAQDLTIQQFKDEYGKTPQELAEENKQFKEDAKNAKLQAFKNKISAFGEKLKKELNVAPKFADKITKFMESQTVEMQPVIKFMDDEDKEAEKPAIEYFQDVLTAIFKEAAKDDGQLFVPDNEMEDVDFDDDGAGVGVDDRQKVHEKAVKKANKLVSDGKFKDFNTAYNAVVFQEV